MASHLPCSLSALCRHPSYRSFGASPAREVIRSRKLSKLHYLIADTDTGRDFVCLRVTSTPRPTSHQPNHFSLVRSAIAHRSSSLRGKPQKQPSRRHSHDFTPTLAFARLIPAHAHQEKLPVSTGRQHPVPAIGLMPWPDLALAGEGTSPQSTPTAPSFKHLALPVFVNRLLPAPFCEHQDAENEPSIPTRSESTAFNLWALATPGTSPDIESTFQSKAVKSVCVVDSPSKAGRENPSSLEQITQLCRRRICLRATTTSLQGLHNSRIGLSLSRPPPLLSFVHITLSAQPNCLPSSTRPKPAILQHCHQR